MAHPPEATVPSPFDAECCSRTAASCSGTATETCNGMVAESCNGMVAESCSSSMADHNHGIATLISQPLVQTADQHGAITAAVRSLHDELQSLRAVHAQELSAVKMENAQLRQWRRESKEESMGSSSTHAADSELLHVLAEHQKQQALLRKLLDEETSRCAAARAEVLAVSIAAGNERLALHAELGKFRRQAAERKLDAAEGMQIVRSEAEEREDVLRRALHAAERRCETQAVAAAKVLADAAQKGQTDQQLLSELRSEVATLNGSLRAARAAIVQADERAAKSKSENAELRMRVQALEASAAKARTRRLHGALTAVRGKAALATVARAARQP